MFSSPKERNPGTMETRSTNPEKENHLIEAIVFTTDFLSYGENSKNKISKKRSRWICGGDRATDSAEERYENEIEFENEIEDGEGLFGMNRKRLISYENSEDLNRKLDALCYHRQRSPFSRITTPEVRDDGDDDCGERHTKNDDDDSFYRDLQRRIDEVTSSTNSTCTSTTLSLPQEESNHRYSSTWDSVSCHGSPRESRGVPPLNDATCNHLQTTKKARKNSSRRKHSHHRAPDITLRHRTSSSEPSPLPDFLKDMEFRSTGSYRLPVIDLPSSPPISSNSESDQRLPHTLRNGSESENQNAQIITTDSQMAFGVSNKKGPHRGDNGDRRSGFLRGAVSSRQFGRRTKQCWQKARRFLRR